MQIKVPEIPKCKVDISKISSIEKGKNQEHNLKMSTIINFCLGFQVCFLVVNLFNFLFSIPFRGEQQRREEVSKCKVFVKVLFNNKEVSRTNSK